MAYPRIEPKNVLITGCSSGIGLAAAGWLQARGWHVIPTARAPADIEALQRRGFSPLGMDLTDPDAVRQTAVDALARFSGRPGALVNNAGYGQAGAVEDLSREVLRRQFEVNVFGAQQLTNEFLPAMIDRGQGRIVNISSVLGRITLPFYAAYCASKFAMESLSDGLRIELAGTGVAVSLIEPGPIESRFHAGVRDRFQAHLESTRSRHALRYQRQSGASADGPGRSFFRLPPEAVARAIEHALIARHPRRRYRITIPAHLGECLRRLVPDLVADRLLRLALNPISGLSKRHR